VIDTYYSQTDRRAELAEKRIPVALAVLRRGEDRSFRRCRSMSECLYRELRAWFRSKPPFSHSLPQPAGQVTPTQLKQALDTLQDFQRLDRRQAFEQARVVLAFDSRTAVGSQEN